jgi:hypothetical protein
MATATATPTLDAYPNGIDQGERFIYARGEVAISASPATYATGGLSLNWASLTGMDGGFQLPVSPTDLAAPVDVDFRSQTGSGWVYRWNKANNMLQIMAASGGSAGTGAPEEEMTNGTAIPAGVSGDTIRFLAVFVRMRS